MFKIINLLAIILTTQFVQAGDKIGNGGGLWTCTANQSLQLGMLVDLYEAEEEFSLPLISTNQVDPLQIVQDRDLYIKVTLPSYYYFWNKKLNESLQKIHYVNSELTIVDDALFRVKPLSTTCAAGWVYTQFANFTNQDQILIRQDLWNSSAVAPLHKAALIWHEVIYSWLREQYQDTDSVRARQIVGLLFSTLPSQDILNRIEKIVSPLPTNPNQSVWFCSIKNNNSFYYFGDYGQSQIEASSLVTQKCQSLPNGFHCDERSLSCEEISKQSVQKICQLKNQQNNKTYLGKGRNLLEAEFKTREQCQTDTTTQPIFCDHKFICQ
jgi:hypothetical protein